jgi:uncharacterized repeat protein (TIGR01451 family)
VENTRIDTTQNTSDDSPAQASIAVPNADIVVTKSGPATAIVGNTFNYTVTYQNNGPTGAQNVIVRDTLPAQVAFVSASGAAFIRRSGELDAADRGEWRHRELYGDCSRHRCGQRAECRLEHF